METSTPTDFSKMAKEIQDLLKMIGLTDYEAKAFLAVVYLGGSDAENIARIAQIPRTSSYKVLESLEEKGLVIPVEGKPKIYKPRDLKILEEGYIRKIKDLFSYLKLAQELYGEKGEPQIVYTLYGKNKVLQKLGELIDKSEEEIYLSSPRLLDIKKALSENIKRALQRNVEIIIVTSRTQRAPAGTKVHYRDFLIATDFVSDSKRAFIADAELNACGFTENPVLAEHLKHFIEMLMHL